MSLGQPLVAKARLLYHVQIRHLAVTKFDHPLTPHTLGGIDSHVLSWRDAVTCLAVSHSFLRAFSV